jgi:hypothetical protein
VLAEAGGVWDAQRNDWRKDVNGKRVCAAQPVVVDAGYLFGTYWFCTYCANWWITDELLYCEGHWCADSNLAIKARLAEVFKWREHINTRKR